MKRLLLLITSLLAIQVVLFAENNQTIQLEQLPQKAQDFITGSFDHKKIKWIIMDKEWIDTDYDIIFTDGSKIEFDKKGEWQKVKCKRSYVPENIIPEQILNYVKTKHSKLRIIEIEKKKKGYEIELDNGLEITFDKEFNVIRYDD